LRPAIEEVIIHDIVMPGTMNETSDKPKTYIEALTIMANAFATPAYVASLTGTGLVSVNTPEGAESSSAVSNLS
jgi:hypothetical protein